MASKRQKPPRCRVGKCRPPSLLSNDVSRTCAVVRNLRHHLTYMSSSSIETSPSGVGLGLGQ